ncbi:autotransporter domain-containing protein [Pseudooceanicola sp. 216_PA32_1]|uniref:Autotransporter domain-containing protein n=1 Tax=Pseudooceanicola pacificus TaxID=2676438 RepID=A0A844W4T5_9RHOB|nr:autotransporter outer membrane beta-barrel domain-containing protein [Pseudooceanicola pacificus]MWB77821.1 autotransporter domain-containing protein [Pseudooceanicola pacificus]
MTRQLLRVLGFGLAALAPAAATAASCNGAMYGPKFRDGNSITYGYSDMDPGERFAFDTINPEAVDNILIRVNYDGQSFLICNDAASCQGASFVARKPAEVQIEMGGRATPGMTFGIEATCTPNTTGPDEDEEPGTGGDDGTPPTDEGTDTGTDTGTQPSEEERAAAEKAAAERAAAIQREKERQARVLSHQVTTLAATGATGAVRSGIASALAARRGGAPGTVGSQGFFLSSQGRSGAPVQAWLSFKGRKYDGTVDGQSYDLTLGVDTTLGNGVVLGGVLSYGTLDVTASGTDVEAKALSYGAYISAPVAENLTIDAQILGARPEYTFGPTSYDADRLSGALRMNYRMTLGAAEVTTFASIAGFSEDHPAAVINAAAVPGHTVSSLTGSLGARADFALSGGVRPYVSLAVDFNRFEDGFGTTTRNTSPRLGLGMTARMGAGTFQVDFDGGEILDGTRDYGLSLGYAMHF